MEQQEKALEGKAGNMSSIPETHRMEGETNPHKLSFDLHTHSVALVPAS